jgi:hypothetical protein
MATPKEIMKAVAAEVAAAGIRVTFVDGWESRGVGGAFTPQGVVCHHTGTPASSPGDYPTLQTILDGRRSGPEPVRGPLAHFGLGRSGQVLVIAAGKAQHAGKGGARGLSGNHSVWGIEAENDGGGVWPAVQLDVYHRLVAAIARHTGFGADKVIAHREWTPRKPDPAGIDMDAFRARVATLLTTKEPERENPDMFIFDGPDGGIFRTDGITRWPVRSMDTASLLLDIGRVRHLGKLSRPAFDELQDGEASARAIQQELATLRQQLSGVEQKVEGVATKVATLT